MSKNIFQIWNDNGQKTPFAARRTHWSDQRIYVIINKVEPNGKGYGNAYGYPTTNGYLNTYFSHSPLWHSEKRIPNPGVYGWEYVEGVSLELLGRNTMGKTSKDDYCIKTKKQGCYDLNSRLNFGRHRGVTLSEIIHEDPSYIVWAINNITGFAISDEAMQFLATKTNLTQDI